MPRYVYKCSECEHVTTIFHLLSETVEECPVCLVQNAMIKQLTTPFYKKKTEQQSQKVGKLTKDFIELNKEVLEEEKAKREEYEPT